MSVGTSEQDHWAKHCRAQEACRQGTAEGKMGAKGNAKGKKRAAGAAKQ